MRFENSALKGVRLDSRNLDNLLCCRDAAHDPNRGSRHASQFCQKSYDRLVGLAIHRSRRDVKFPGFTELSCKLGLASSGADFKRESCFHYLLPLRQLPFSATRYAPADR
jgi:hypothetical protein